MIIFCFICKRHVEAIDIDEFEARGHDGTSVAQLRHGLVGAYKRDLDLADLDIEPEIVEAFRNEKRIAA